MTSLRTSSIPQSSVLRALAALAFFCLSLGVSPWVFALEQEDQAPAITSEKPLDPAEKHDANGVRDSANKEATDRVQTCPEVNVCLPDRTPNDVEEKDFAEDPSSIVRGQQNVTSSPEALAYLLPLRRNCLPESKCALKIEPPTSSHGELLPLANELSGLMALKLDDREALCIDDREGKWSNVTGEAIPDCPETAHGPHQVKVRLDAAGDGFVATVAFTEFSQPSKHDLKTNSFSPAFVPRPSSLRLTTTFEESADIPFVADRMAQGLGNAMGTDEPSIFDVFLKPPTPPSFHLNLKLGNTISSLKGFDFSAFTLKFELEIAYYLRSYLLAFLEVGLTVGNAASSTNSDQSSNASPTAIADDATDQNSLNDDANSEEPSKKSGAFSLIPVKFGLKFIPFHQYDFRPYIGLGLGMGILSDLVEADSRELTLSFSGNLGIAWVPFNHLGFNLEAGLNFDELRVEGGSNLLFGFSVNFGLLVLF